MKESVLFNPNNQWSEGTQAVSDGKVVLLKNKNRRAFIQIKSDPYGEKGVVLTFKRLFHNNEHLQGWNIVATRLNCTVAVRSIAILEERFNDLFLAYNIIKHYQNEEVPERGDNAKD